MKKPRKRPSARGKRVPTMRFKLDGSWWKVKIMRPPSRELCEGMTHFDDRIIYLHPEALKKNGLGIIVHETAHAAFPVVDEAHVLDQERIASVIARWASRYTDKTITIGQHKAS
jgi:hypothetical protein